MRRNQLLRSRALAALVCAAATTTGAFLAAGARADDTGPQRPGAAATGTLLPNGWRVTPAGRHLPLAGDMPVRMLLSPDSKYLAVVTAGFHDHGVTVFSVATEKPVDTADLGKDWAGADFAPDGKTLYVAAGWGSDEKTAADTEKGGGVSAAWMASLRHSILRLSVADGHLATLPPLDIPDNAGKERWTSGIAAGAAGSLYAADTEGNAVYRLDAATGSEQASAKVGYRPYGVALSPDGRTVAVSNWGDSSVSLLDATTLRESVRVNVGSHPNELVWSPDSKRVYAACAGSNAVAVISSGRASEIIKTSLDPRAPVGSTPIALALSPDGRRLFVANADNNDVAVVDVEGEESRVIGFIPTGWYPSALAVSPDGKRLFVGTGKGLQFRANFPVQSAAVPTTSYDGKTKFDYIGDALSGAVSVVDLPNADQLLAYTKQVRSNVPTPEQATLPVRVAEARRAFRKIRHVLFIIRENRTYDQLFGDVASGDGDPNLTMYGETVTPNAHALARQTVLLDNLYCNGEVSEDGHQWCDAAYATDFTEKGWVGNYSGRGEPDADERLTASPAGYLWDNCAKHGLTYRSYGEFSSFKSTPNAPPVFTGYPTLNGHACPGWDYTKHRDPELAALFLNELKTAETTGEWPRFMIMSLGEDHTTGLKAGTFTPSAAVASNDQALGKIVEAVSHSRFWHETAIFVIEDDAQNGPDHVDAHRTAGLVISPYVRKGVVDSTLYTTASFVRTMEIILGIPAMTQFDAAATPLYSAFSAAPVQTAFVCLPPRVDLLARNPDNTPGAKQSAKLDLSVYDHADPDILNALLWHDAHPGRPMPAPVRSSFTVAVAER